MRLSMEEVQKQQICITNLIATNAVNAWIGRYKTQLIITRKRILRKVVIKNAKYTYVQNSL